MSKVHIGKKIKEVLDKSHLTVVDFAKKISITRDGAYKIFEKEQINTALLGKISDVLQHDFFSYYAVPANFKENKINYGYATKVELAELADSIKLLSQQIESLQKQLLVKPRSRKSSKRAKK